MPPPPLLLLLLTLLTLTPPLAHSANWAQLAGFRSQNIAKPYIPLNTPYTPAEETARPMWSARWGHSTAVFNSSNPRDDVSLEENSARKISIMPKLLVMGGDDRVEDGHMLEKDRARSEGESDLFVKQGLDGIANEGTGRSKGSVGEEEGGEYENEHRTAVGTMLNDVWYSAVATGGESGWSVVDDDLLDKVDKSEVFYSSMVWKQSNEGQVSPATWPTTGLPMTYNDWIQCQDFILSSLPEVERDAAVQNCVLDPVCVNDPVKVQQMEDFYLTPGNALWPEECKPQAYWKDYNMWSPRRGHKAVVAASAPRVGGSVTPDYLYVMGGRAREYARIDDDRVVGGIVGPRVNTEIDRVTIREETVLKNDIWVSEDGIGEKWSLVNPGCMNPQRDVLRSTELWQKYDHRNMSSPNPGPEQRSDQNDNVGRMSSQCTVGSSGECYGVEVCEALAEGSSTGVCVCPMWSPRENHAATVQHIFKKDADNVTTISEDYVYVVGGFINIRKSFCGSYSCGSNGYRFYMDDAWVSNDGGINWVQFKNAFDSTASGFMGRGAHAIALVSQSLGSPVWGKKLDQLWIFGGESGDDETGETNYLNDVWWVDLPKEPCCVAADKCDDPTDPSHALSDDDIFSGCLPNLTPEGRDAGTYSLKRATASAEWAPRSGHSVVLEPAERINGYIPRIIMIGGNDEEEVFDDVWSWGFQDPLTDAGEAYPNPVYECPPAEEGMPYNVNCAWFKDYDPGQWYRKDDYYGPGFGLAEDGPLAINYRPLAPQQYYFYGGSPIDRLARVALPEPQYPEVDLIGSVEPIRYPYLSDKDIEQINGVGIFTLDDLRSAELIQIIQLRGLDPDENGEILEVGDKICDVLELAKAIEEKCEVRQIRTYEMEDKLPKNLDIEFEIGSADPDAYWQWRGGGAGSNSHGKVLGQTAGADGCEGSDDVLGCMMENWNGCTVLPDGDEGPTTEVDINGIGAVPVPENVRDPAAALQEVKCRQNPGRRTMAGGEFWEQKVILIGGRQEMNGGFKRDVWERRDRIPSIFFVLPMPERVPEGYSDSAKFNIKHDTAGGLIEYKIVDYDEKQEVIPWTLVESNADLNVHTLLDRQPFDYVGPGSGWYVFYMRAIDPAGNVGYQFDKDNVYLWQFKTPPPWPLIIGSIILGVAFLLFCYMEYRRRKKKAAMERYAIKRMRRKFKGQAKGEDKKGQDWRALATEGDEGGEKKDKKKKKKKKDKSKKKKSLKDRTKDKDKKKDKKSKKSKDKDKKGSKSKDKDKKSKDKDKKKKKKESKEGDKNKKKDSKEKDYDKKKSKGGSSKEADSKAKDKERKKEK